MSSKALELNTPAVQRAERLLSTQEKSQKQQRVTKSSNLEDVLTHTALSSIQQLTLDLLGRGGVNGEAGRSSLHNSCEA